MGLLRWFRARREEKAHAAAALAGAPKCQYCREYICVGDFVAVTVGGNYVHAGFHYDRSGKSVICETGAVGIGYWDGSKLEGIGDSLAAKAMKTGKPQVM